MFFAPISSLAGWGFAMAGQRKTGQKRRQQNPLTYKDRNKVVRAFAHLDRFRSIQTRFCRYATNWEGLIQLGCSLMELLKNL
jgi:transposase